MDEEKDAITHVMSQDEEEQVEESDSEEDEEENSEEGDYEMDIKNKLDNEIQKEKSDNKAEEDEQTEEDQKQYETLAYKKKKYLASEYPIKLYVKDKMGSGKIHVNRDFMEMLNLEIMRLLDKAVERAKANGRTMVKGDDL